MDYTVSLYWNGALVCHAMATATVSSDLALGHIRDNFTGRDHAAQIARYSNRLDLILAMTPLQTLAYAYCDDTGAARAVITKVR